MLQVTLLERESCCLPSAKVKKKIVCGKLDKWYLFKVPNSVVLSLDLGAGGIDWIFFTIKNSAGVFVHFYWHFNVKILSGKRKYSSVRLNFASPVNTINGNIINGPNRPATWPTDFSFFSLIDLKFQRWTMIFLTTKFKRFNFFLILTIDCTHN